MKRNDAQLSFPEVLYKNTKANIEALTGVPEGAVAYATDTDQIGAYTGAVWKWGGAIWGAISGVLSSQIDLQAELDGKATLFHNHDSYYSAIGHNHSGVYSVVGHTHDHTALTTIGTNTHAQIDTALAALPTTYAPIMESCTAYHNTTQTIGTGTGWTTVALNTDLSDALNWHDPVTNNHRITPAGSNGVREYMVVVQLMSFASNATGIRGIRIVDGAGNTWNQFDLPAINGDVTNVPLVAQRVLATSDFIYVQVRQTSGGNLNLNAFCKVTVNRVK